jgi:hypothetical protein
MNPDLKCLPVPDSLYWLISIYLPQAKSGRGVLSGMFEQTFKNIDDRPKQYEWFQSTLHKLADAIPPFVGGLDADPATQFSEHKGPSS